MLIALCTGMQKQMFHVENIARLKPGFENQRTPSLHTSE